MRGHPRAHISDLRLALLGDGEDPMGLLLGLPIWPEFALSLESIRGHDREAGLEGRGSPVVGGRR
jgi:hypothetical protein